MNQRPELDDRLHSALTDIGPGLPEPEAPIGLRERITAMPYEHAPLWPRVRTGMLAAAAVALAVLSGLMYLQNQRLHTRLTHVLAAQSPGAVVPARRDLPPLVAVRFYHPLCPIARAVAPRFDEMEDAHCNEQVLFVSLDISESKEAQAAKLAEAIGCDFVLRCDGAPAASGMVVLGDTRSRTVIKASHDEKDFGDLEQALDAALVACSTEGSGG